MKPALIIVDMLKDIFNNHPEAFITKEALKFLPTINHLSAMFRDRALPVIFSCDSFLQSDFIFQGKMKPHSIRGTDGTTVIDELDRGKNDIISPKRRFSAFFKTDLDQILRTLGCDTVTVAGIATHICVLTTVLDAVALDFKAILLKDCCASHKREYHTGTIESYKNSPLYPLIKIMSSQEFIDGYFCDETQTNRK